MSSFPHFYSDLLYPNTFSDVQTLLMPPSITNNTINHNNNNNNNVNVVDLASMEQTSFTPPFDPNVSPEQSSDVALSPLLTMPCPDFYGPVSDMAVPSLPEFNMSLYGIHSLIGTHPPVPGPCEYDNELFGFVPDVKPLYRHTWGSENSYEMHGVEETNIKVASRYSEEERKERILRYLKKRNQRNFNKTIKYACRKTLADRRTRVRGRFARNNNNELICDTQIPLQTNQLTTPTNTLIKQRDQLTNKEEEERWLQELAASLMYLPYA